MAPSGSIENEGNTNSFSRISCSKYWVFTWNNYPTNFGSFVSMLESNTQWYIFQEEIGANGTPHLQGSLCLTTKGRPKEIFGIKEIHWEKTRAIKESIAYCNKSETKNGKTYTNIKMDEPLRLITDLYPWQQSIVNEVSLTPDDRTINWFWESIGCSGKTALCKYLVAKHDALYVSGKSTDIKFAVVKYKETKKIYPTIILWNIPRCIEHISYEAIESIKDGLFFSSKYESSMICMNSPHIYIFANEPPETTKLSRDRWRITKIPTESKTEQKATEDIAEDLQ